MAALYAAIELIGLSYVAGRGVSYLAAATFTWACNRSSPSQKGPGGEVGQWVRFLAVNSAGGAVNFAVYLFVVAAIGSRGGCRRASIQCSRTWELRLDRSRAC